MDEYVKITASTDEELAALNLKTNKLNLIWPFMRADLTKAMMAVEEMYYPPDTERNDLYEYRVYEWKTLPFCISTMPWEDVRTIKLYLKYRGVRFNDGPPCMVKEQDYIALANFKPEDAIRHGKNVVAVFPLNNNKSFGIQPDNGGNATQPIAVAVTIIPKGVIGG